jgi:hypothetical protein
MYVIQALVMNSWPWDGFTNALLMGLSQEESPGQVFSASGFWGSVGSSAFVGAGTGGITALLTVRIHMHGAPDRISGPDHIPITTTEQFDKPKPNKNPPETFSGGFFCIIN